jgi:biotin transport system substrate-specific component
MTTSTSSNAFLSLRDMILVSIFTAILAVLAYIAFPLPFSPVPVTGQTFGIMLVGLVLGRKRGVVSVLLLIVLGIMGIPVFSGARAGLGVVFGPTGGYILSWLLAVIVTDAIYSKFRSFKGALLAAFMGGVVTVYAIGVPWLALSTGMTLPAAIAAGALPFIPGDLFKVFAVALTVGRLPKRLRF